MDSSLVKFRNLAVLSPLLLSQQPDSTMAMERAAFILNPQFVQDSMPIQVGNLNGRAGDMETGNVQAMSFNQPATEWTASLQKRFDELARLEAFEKITSPQAEELESLAQLRRNLEYPRSSEEVLWEYNQRRITSNLIKAIQEYAKFHDGADSQGRSARPENP